MDNNKDWKTKNKPSSCTAAPWEFLIPFEIRAATMRQIRQECIDKFGYSFDECPKRMVCIGKDCLGRSLPWESPTAKPYLELLKETQVIVNDEMFIQTDCSKCPIYTSCKTPCYQVSDYLKRDSIKEPTIYYKENYTAKDVVSIDNSNTNSKNIDLLFNGNDIPWDCLVEKKQQVVKKYLYDQLDFKYIADQLDLNNQARCKYEFYSAVNKLSEYGVMRNFIEHNIWKLTNRQRVLLEKIYFENKSFTEVAKEMRVSKQSIQQTVARVVKKYNLKWTKYVKRQGKKIVYLVPEIFR